MPKKGHVCTGKPVATGENAKTTSEAPKKKAKVVKAAADIEDGEVEADGAWDPSAVLTLVKAVLPKTTGENKGTGVSKRKRKKDETAPPPMLGQTEAEKAMLELDVIRPPSLITPADGEMLQGLGSSISTRSGLRSGGRQGGVPGGPPSLLSSFFGTEGSSGSIFSPSALMNGFVESPAPALSSSPSLSTPGLGSPCAFLSALAFPSPALPSASGKA